MNHQNEAPSPHRTVCSICLIPSTQMVPFNDCNHEYCLQCMLAHARSRISDFKPVNCPTLGCYSLLKPWSPLFGELTPQEQHTFYKIKQFQLIFANKHLHSCRMTECYGTFSDNEQPSCNQCGAFHCLICKQLSHQGLCMQQVAANLQQNQLYIRCKKCHNLVERDGGCPRMRCVCGFIFCYSCGQALESNHVCQGRQNCLKTLWLDGEQVPLLRQIFNCLRFGRATYCLQKLAKLIVVIAFVWPLLILTMLGIMALLLLSLLIVFPYVLLQEQSTIQFCLRQCTNLGCAIIIIIILHPLFAIYTICFTMTMIGQSNIEDLKTTYRIMLFIFIMPIMIVAC